MDIKLNVPVTLFDYKASDNPLYSLAKLKIFYVGQTADKRLFTKKFSDELLKSLPYVPVVGYYDVEKEDFKGHNGSIQHIYGLVPESTKVEYVKEDNREFAVCDIILYTGRKDETGEIAQKIVGKPHSLELNPEDTTYKVNKDANGKIQNIEFTSGTLVGLSVLGDDEKPAFTGSEFFAVQEENFQEILQGFKTEWEKFTNRQQTQRDDGMKNQVMETIKNFIEKTYSEKVVDLYGALSERYKYFYIVQLFDSSCVINLYDEETNSESYIRLSYSSVDGSYSFGEAQVVLPRYLTEQEIADWETLKNAANAAKTEEDDEDNEEEDDEEDFNSGIQTTVSTEGDNTHEDQGQQSTSVENHSNNSNEQTEEGEKAKKQEELGKTTLIDSERIELETFRKEKKFNLISSFGKSLTKEFLDNLIQNIEKYSIEELEIILSKEFTKITLNKQQEIETQQKNKFIPLTYIQTIQKNDSEVLSIIDRYKDKE